MTSDAQAPAIVRFAGAWRFLSNPWPITMTYDWVEYPSAEHLFHALKTDDPALRRQIAETPKWQDAKALGHELTLPSDWDHRRRYDAMRSVLWLKFRDPELGARLAHTRDAMLVEGNTWHDNTWGACTCFRPECRGRGHNLLGWMLMRIRSEIAQLHEDMN